MPQDKISIRGARVHTLKNIDVTIPRDRLVVITGLSGSGKSSLAFDTIFAEGQRRYVESLSTYARQFLQNIEKPDVDAIEGLSPALAIDQRGATQNPRSTVGTVTEIYDYLRLLYARIGHPHCPKCGRAIGQQTVQHMVDAVFTLPKGSRLMLLAPLVKEHQDTYEPVFDEMRRSGYVRVRVDGTIFDLSDEIKLDQQKKHTIEVVVDRLVIPREIDLSFRQRVTDSLETTLSLGAGIVLVSIIGGAELLFSEHPTCAFCGISLPDIAPLTFSFNSPHGACPTCGGLGEVQTVDPEQVADQAEVGSIHQPVQVVAQGTPQEIMANPHSLTGAYLARRRAIPLPEQRREGNGRALTIKGAREHNLKHVTVEIPLGKFVVVTGVSGSGKSTLISDILYRELASTFSRAHEKPGVHDSIEGLEELDAVIGIEQSPIGRTPRSNPATYTGAFTGIRELFAKV